jgi:hypothetical protein
MVRGFWFCALALAVNILAGCDRGGPGGGDFVARVGTSVLTREDLPPLGATPDSAAAVMSFINEWVATELVFEEAKRRGFLESDEVRSTMRAVEKRIAVDALLREVMFRETSSVSEDEINAYYSSNQNSFVLREDVALVSFVLFDDRAIANSFRSDIVRGTSWEDALHRAHNDTSLALHMQQVATQRYATQATLFPAELWKVSRTLKNNSVSFVIGTDEGHYVLFLHEFRRQGELPDLAYVSGEIRERLETAYRHARYEDLLSDLRVRFPVEIRFGSQGADSTNASVE